MLQAPYDHPLNLATQALLTFTSWSIALVLFAAALIAAGMTFGTRTFQRDSA